MVGSHQQGNFLICEIPYSGKFSREKTIMNFEILQPPAKLFDFHKILGMPQQFYAISLTFHKSFLHKMLPFYHSMKVFSLKCFPLYRILDMYAWGQELSRQYCTYILVCLFVLFFIDNQ